MQNQTEPLVDAKPVQQLIGIKGKDSFWRFVHSEGMPAYRMNARCYRFRMSEVEQWLASRRTGSN